MERKILTERLYKLSEYQNIKLGDEISLEGLPEKVLLNPELVQELRYLQMVNCELSYRRYLKLSEKLHHLDLEQAIGFLEESKVNLLDEIQQHFEKGDLK